MTEYLLVGLAGFLACMVDGALGMGFGPTASTLLLGSGLSPAAVSTTVNLAKVATGVAGAVSHWGFGNVDRRIVVRLAVPGVLGAGIGVTVLANVDGDQLRPVLAALLLAVGVRILVRFARGVPGETNERSETPPRIDERGIAAAGVAGGVTNGLIGAWGPVVTPVLLHKGLPARFTVGSVNTAEVAVAVVSLGALLGSLGGAGFDVGVAVAMLVGGVLAAPLAAWAVRHLPARGMGIAVAGLLLFTNLRELAGWAGLGPVRWLLYALLVAALAVAAVAPRARAVAPAPR